MSTDLQAAAERLTENCWDGYLAGDPKTRDWPKIVDAVLADGRAVAEAYRELVPADDDEPLDIDWLCERGAKWSTDGTALVIKGDCGPEIACGVNRRSGEDYVGSMGLYWSYSGTSPKVSLSYLLEDDPTKGQLRRLAACLGIVLTESSSAAQRQE